MKDQRLLLRKCLINNIPAYIFHGNDQYAVNILKSAEEIYKKEGCSMEFLYDFNSLIRDFEKYQNEHKENLSGPNIEKNHKEFLNKCIYQDTPVIVFQGTDRCATNILKSAEEIYKSNNCIPAFLSELNSKINDFRLYNASHLNEIKLPNLSESEKEFVREDMDFDFDRSIKKGDFVRLTELKERGYHPSLETIQSLPKTISDTNMIAFCKIYHIEAKGNTIGSIKLTNSHSGNNLQMKLPKNLMNEL